MTTEQKRKKAERNHAWYLANKERVLALHKEWLATHSEQVAATAREYHAKHKDQLRAYNAAYAIEHKKELSELWAREYREHIDEKREYNAAYNAAHKEKASAYRREHRKELTLREAKRRAQKYGNTPVSELLTEAQWRDVLDQYHHRCAYCGRKVAELTIDHVVPLSRGGKHSASNVVPACQHCNSSKSAKTPEEWVGVRVR